MEIESLPVVPELIFPPKIVLGIINLAAGLSPLLAWKSEYSFVGGFFYPQTKSRDERMRLRQFGASLTRRRKWKGSCFGAAFRWGDFLSSSDMVWFDGFADRKGRALFIEKMIKQQREKSWWKLSHGSVPTRMIETELSESKQKLMMIKF